MSNLQETAISEINQKIKETVSVQMDLDESDDEDAHKLFSNTLDSLLIRRDILSCSKCHLRETCPLPVPFSGTVDAYSRGLTICALSEAPGPDEDYQFISRAAKSVGLKIDAHLNTVCCPPPKRHGSYSPILEEVQACRVNLVQQIQHLDPWLIICFGGVALQALRPEFRITRDHGVVFPSYWPEINDGTCTRTHVTQPKHIWAIGVFSPSYVRRSGKGSPESHKFAQDIKHISQIIQCREYFGESEIYHRMVHAAVGAPCIPTEAGKVNKSRQTYLQVQDNIEAESIKYGQC